VVKAYVLYNVLLFLYLFLYVFDVSFSKVLYILTFIVHALNVLDILNHM
jgi:hypothetical protein